MLTSRQGSNHAPRGIETENGRMEERKAELQRERDDRLALQALEREDRLRREAQERDDRIRREAIEREERREA